MEKGGASKQGTMLGGASTPARPSSAPTEPQETKPEAQPSGPQIPAPETLFATAAVWGEGTCDTAAENCHTDGPACADVPGRLVLGRAVRVCAAMQEADALPVGPGAPVRPRRWANCRREQTGYSTPGAEAPARAQGGAQHLGTALRSIRRGRARDCGPQAAPPE